MISTGGRSYPNTGHSCCITESGLVFSWGNGSSGQLGLGTTDPVFKPRLVHGLPEVTAVACGASHTCFLSADGRVFACGEGAEGQLGQDSTKRSLTPMQVSGSLCGQIVRGVSCGISHSAAVTKLGHLYTWGNGDNGQLGHASDGNIKSLPQRVTGLLSALRIGSVSCGAWFTGLFFVCVVFVYCRKFHYQAS